MATPPSKRTLPTRKRLPHDPPHFIGTSDATFFITICCDQRHHNQLCRADVSSVLFQTTTFYEEQGHWYIQLMLLMPDHLHLLARFGDTIGMKAVVERWKRFTATKAKIRWQRDFFDHRLRGDQSLDAKGAYIRQNPVRAGLVHSAEDWPYVLEAT